MKGTNKLKSRGKLIDTYRLSQKSWSIKRLLRQHNTAKMAPRECGIEPPGIINKGVS